ncbi:MAG: histidine phosphatase family protein [Candidatus Omnitrophica bacterium]|nr:histidine phosphatase family protein [Candidatus Omnitrophota bacterium]
MKRLILIRHGETDCNLEARYCGFCNFPLNEKGVWQSRKLAARIKRFRIDKVYSSDLKRACQTSEILFRKAKIEKFPDLREINVGIFEGLRYEEIAERHGRLYKKWLADPFGVKIPEGESFTEMRTRVRKRLAFIASTNAGKTVAIISHGGPIRVVLNDALGRGPKRFWEITLDNCALSIIDFSAKRKPRAVKINDTAHLK